MTVSSPIEAARYAGDVRAMDAILADTTLGKVVADARSTAGIHSARQHLLSEAVRINPRLLPGLAGALREVAERARIDQPLEAYVHSSPEINAGVIMAHNRKLVLLTSGAIERLTGDELNFVIGHELGHAYYGHIDVPIRTVLEKSTKINARQAMQLLAWCRKSEISADRVGLLCCSGVEVAASAMFKTLSGLCLEGFRVDPEEFASQWDELAAEMSRDATGDYWRASHPFPPLRMKALLLFWSSDLANTIAPAASGATPLAEVDSTIERYLAMMDPLARDDAAAQGSADPMLTEFLLWGSLYVAASDGRIDDAELENLCSLVGRDTVDRALAAGEPTPTQFRERFLKAKTDRRAKLKALELHRIFSGLATIAKADGWVAPAERAALCDLAGACGVNEAFIDTLL